MEQTGFSKKVLYLSGIGIACLFLDHLINANEYSKLSFMGIFMLSFGILYGIVLIDKNENPDVLLIRHSGLFLSSAGVLTILLVLAYAYFFQRLMADIINFSFGLLTIGISLMIIRPYSCSDEELKELMKQGQEKKGIQLLLQQTPLFKKIIWIGSAVAGVVIAEIYKFSSVLTALLFKELQ